MSLDITVSDLLRVLNECEAQSGEENITTSTSLKFISDEALKLLFKDFVYDPKALTWVEGEKLSNIKLLLGKIRGCAFYDGEATVGDALLLFVKIHLCGLSTLIPTDKNSLFWQVQCQVKTAYCGLLSINAGNTNKIEEVEASLSASSITLKSIKIPQTRITKNSTVVQKARNEQALLKEKAINDSLLAIDTMLSLCTNDNVDNTFIFLNRNIREVTLPEQCPPFDAIALQHYVKQLFISLLEDLSTEQFHGLYDEEKNSLTPEYLKEIMRVRDEISKLEPLFLQGLNDLKTLQMIDYKLSNYVEDVILCQTDIIPAHRMIMRGFLGTSNTMYALKNGLKLLRFNAYLQEITQEQHQKEMLMLWNDLAFIRAFLAYSSEVDFSVLMSNEKESEFLLKQESSIFELVQSKFADFNSKYQEDYDQLLNSIQDFYDPKEVSPQNLLRIVRQSNALLEKAAQVMLAFADLIKDELTQCEKTSTVPSNAFFMNCLLIKDIYSAVNESFTRLKSHRIYNNLKIEKSDFEAMLQQKKNNRKRNGGKKQEKPKKPASTNVSRAISTVAEDQEQDVDKILQWMRNALPNSANSNNENMIESSNLEFSSEKIPQMTETNPLPESRTVEKKEDGKKATDSQNIGNKNTVQTKATTSSKPSSPSSNYKKANVEENVMGFTGRDRKQRNFINALTQLGFYPARIKGDHQIMKNKSGKTITVPLHTTVALGTAQEIIKQATGRR